MVGAMPVFSFPYICTPTTQCRIFDWMRIGRRVPMCRVTRRFVGGVMSKVTWASLRFASLTWHPLSHSQLMIE